MSTIQIFESATTRNRLQAGTFATDFDWAREQGGTLERFDTGRAEVLAANPAVQEALASKGEDALPISMVDGKLALSGRYPKRGELASWAGILMVMEAEAGNCCSGGACG